MGKFFGIYMGAGVLLLALFVVLGMTTGGSTARSSYDDEDTEAVAGDAEIAQLIATRRLEAKQWLADPNHIVFEYGRENALKMTNDFYTAGAVGVYAVNVDEFEGKQITASFAVELPTDPAARKRILDKEAELMYGSVEVAGEDRTPDTGQKYLMIHVD
jgi:hypothetical protein